MAGDTTNIWCQTCGYCVGAGVAICPECGGQELGSAKERSLRRQFSMLIFALGVMFLVEGSAYHIHQEVGLYNLMQSLPADLRPRTEWQIIVYRTLVSRWHVTVQLLLGLAILACVSTGPRTGRRKSPAVQCRLCIGAALCLIVRGAYHLVGAFH